MASLQGYKMKTTHLETGGGEVSSAFEGYRVSRDAKKSEPKKSSSLTSDLQRQDISLPCPKNNNRDSLR